MNRASALPVRGHFIAGRVIESAGGADFETLDPSIETDEEAIAIANGVPTGLVAGIHTKDLGRAMTSARRIETGSVWINGWYMGGVQAPTGGTKESGIGHERGLIGVRNFLRVKNVAIRLPSAAPSA